MMEDEINLKVINCDDSYHKPVVKQWFSHVNLLMSLSIVCIAKLL